KARVLSRLDRIEQTGNLGDHRERIMGAVSEIRIDYGPGYRLYYVLQGDVLIVLLGGGTKETQQGDIGAAVALWERNKNDAERFSREFRG
ncbi:MAG: type II toxin-antitoxin system RelE/ParE family toxin, partial [Armatimonadota bacterium]|nr:type II toxin-antitoxin system RelE/ParE family toxin [Armatimonadota bacterium]